MVCARVRAIMHQLSLVHYRYVHVHNHGISKTYILKNHKPAARGVIKEKGHQTVVYFSKHHAHSKFQ